MAPSKSPQKRIPPPDVLEQLAEKLPDAPEFKLDDYAGTIRTLHDEKSLSFTEIVEFLAKHGIEANRSAVYRVYKDAKRERPEEPPLVDPDTGEVVEE